jgi:hypothetical protein
LRETASALDPSWWRPSSEKHIRAAARPRRRGDRLDGLKFDEMTKAMSMTTSRRQALKLLVTTSAGGMLALVGAGGAKGILPGRCRNNGTVCRQHLECCSEFCDPLTLQCACSPGAELCPSSDTCVPACTGTQVFNTETCRCECPTGFTECGSTCCSSAQVCTHGVCCQNPTTCDSTSDCCPDFYCRNGGKGGPGVCTPCLDATCSSTTGCCDGFVCVGGACVPQLTF